MKMPTIVGIFIFINRENFMLNSIEHEKSFITLELDCLADQADMSLHEVHMSKGMFSHIAAQLIRIYTVHNLAVLDATPGGGMYVPCLP